MFDGVHLTLLIGPTVPVPAPQPVIEALETVQVNSGKDRSGFQLTFSVGKTSLLTNVLLPAGFFDPMSTRVVIIATVNGFPNVLMDGVVTRQDMTPSNEPGRSTLTVTGEDLSVVMDVVQQKIVYPGMPEVARVNLILAKYAAYGIVPVVIPPIVTSAPSPDKQIPTQTGTDRAYLRQMASQCGYVFYVEPGPAPMTSIGYFGPDIRLPIPQPALSVNLDWATNVDALSFSLDGLAKKLVVVTIFDPVTKKIPIPIPVPNVSIFHPPLGLRPTPPARVEFPEELSGLEPDEAAKRILGLLLDNPNAISGTGSLSVSRYGSVLRSRMLIGVRGAGFAYDGMYYVDSVTHDIKRGEYKQNFTLSRDGLGSQTPVVGP